MSSWKKAAKANQKTHKERHQPESRKHLGLLEKKKDYKKRADDYHEKGETLKLLRKRTLDKNPDEFYFHMINSRVKNGEHHEVEKEDEHSTEQVKLMQTQDIKYINMKRTMETRKINKLQAQLHMTDVAETTPNTHTFFVDVEEVEDFDVAKRLDTHPALLGRKSNRPRLADLDKIALPELDDETLESMNKKKQKIYSELSKRIEREKELTVIQQKMELKRHLQDVKIMKPKSTTVGMIEELPSGSHLETPLHAKRRRKVPEDRVDFNQEISWSTFLRSALTETATSDLQSSPPLQPEAMSFKIVETIEKGRYVLTTVPASWENQGDLRWPKQKSEKLRRDPFSTPENDWRSMSCVVKRKNIMSFEEAETELRVMTDVSDTDQEIDTQQHVPSKFKNLKTDLNIARQCLETQFQKNDPPPASKVRSEPSQSIQSADVDETVLSNNIPRMGSEICDYLVFSPVNSNSPPEAVQPVQVQAYEYRENTPEIEDPNSDILITHKREETSRDSGEQQVSMINTDILTETTKELSTKLTTLETKVDNLSKNQIIIILNQEQMMQKISEISAQFDEFIKRSPHHLKPTEDIYNETGIKTICNEESLIEFEDLLKNKQNFNELKKVYSVVCGEGKGRAINNAYALCDAMFDRIFLMQCSWSGGSRGETSKICFKTYKHTINFFFKIIHASDKQFTMLECEFFFKTILRNAKKRSESKQLRRSTQKKRPKKECEVPVTANEQIMRDEIVNDVNCFCQET